jgi:uncharacterized membrane protein YeaQ/YmgE (transglycosylase-associated protein family)
MSVGLVLWTIIGGIIIGLLGKFLAPGSRDNIPLWLTIICGIGGILVGNWLYVDVFNGKADTVGFDWWRHITQVVVAAVLVMIAAGVTGRRKAVRA